MNCAGTSFNEQFLSDDADEITKSVENWDKGIKINLYGSYNTAQIAANYMKKK